MVNRFFKFLFKRFNLYDLIEEQNLHRKRQNWFNNISSKNFKYYTNASVINMQNDKNKIQLQENTIVRGHLKVLKYGGEIKIGNNSYIGNNSEIWSGCSVEIGENVLISDYVFISDTNSHEFNHIERINTYLKLIKEGPIIDKGNFVRKGAIDSFKEEVPEELLKIFIENSKNNFYDFK